MTEREKSLVTVGESPSVTYCEMHGFPTAVVTVVQCMALYAAVTKSFLLVLLGDVTKSALSVLKGYEVAHSTQRTYHQDSPRQS